MFTSKVSLSPRDGARIVRPLSRKDIFYSGSVTNLREYQSQKSLTNYRNSVISLTKYEKDARDARDGVSEMEKGGERKCFEKLLFFNLDLKLSICIFFVQNTISAHALFYRNHLNRPLVPCWTLAY